VTRQTRGLAFDQMAIGLLMIVFGAAALVMPAQNDTFWHLRAGADIWRLGHVPRVDTYSHTFAGAPWPDHEWLSQTLMYGAYRLGGMRGLVTAAALCIWGAIAILYRLMVGPRLSRFAPLAYGLATCGVVWVLRPQVLTLFLIALLLWLLVHGRHLVIPPLFLLWANAHGGVVLGGVILGAAWAAALLRWHTDAERIEARRRLLSLSIVVPLAALATAATPNGFAIYRFVIESTQRSYALQISEWFPPKPTEVLGVLFWLAMAAFVAALVVRRRALRAADWGTWVTLAAALALAPLAIRSSRNIAPFLIAWMPAINRVLGPDFRFRRQPRPATADHPLVNLGLVVGLAALAAAAVAFVWIAQPPFLGWQPIPRPALQAIEACPGPLYNHYNEGGFLIWFTPDRPVFVDGRQDPFSMPFLLEHIAVERGKASYRPLFDRYGVRCALLSVESPTAKALATDGWQQRYRDREWVVYAAPPGTHDQAR
jgi:hypothetical protein